MEDGGREREGEAGSKWEERGRRERARERAHLQPSAAHYAKVVPGFISLLQFMGVCMRGCVCVGVCEGVLVCVRGCAHSI